MLAIAGAMARQPPIHALESSRLPPVSFSDVAWRRGVSGQLSAFERVGRGALMVDDRAHVLESNQCVRLGDGLHVTGGVLQASTLLERRRLQRFLCGIMARPKPAASAATTLALSRPSGLRPWLLDGIDCSDTIRDPPLRAVALILITDVERPPRLAPDLLSQVFGLTPTEARLAVEIASGKPLFDVAANLKISEGHARQRLKAVFCKTGTSRQGELIALLAKLS